MGAAFPKPWEQIIDAVERPAQRRGDLGQLQVFFDRQPRDDTAILGHKGKASLADLMGAHGMQRLVIKPNFPMAHFGAAHLRASPQGGGFASPIAAQQCQNFALMHVKADALHDVAFAIIGMQVIDRKERGRCGRHIGVLLEIGFDVHLFLR